MLPYKTGGYLRYDDVPAYDLKWLPKDKAGNPNPEDLRQSFDPAKVWVEDRWMICRRLTGDDICRVLFFKMSTFVWEKNNYHKPEVRELQDALLKHVFRVDSVSHFRESLDEDEKRVMSWDGELYMWMSKADIHRMFLEVCTLGPLVAMFGREFQQYLLEHPDTDKIPSEHMKFSINSGRTSMGERRLNQVYTEKVADDHDDDCISISSKRTRSPRRNYRGAPWNQSPSNRQDIDLRSECSDRRIRDVRQDPNYHNMRESLTQPHRDAGRSREQPPRDDQPRISVYPRDEPPRGSMSSKGGYVRSEPRHYEHKPKEHKPRPPNYPRPQEDEEYRRGRRA